MKILYVAGAGKFGTYVLSCDIFTIWLKHGYDIVLVSPTPEDSLIIEFAHKHRIPVYFIKLFRTFRLDQAIKLAVIARREKVDIIHACLLQPGRFLCGIATLLSGIPLVLFISTPSEIYNPNRVIRWFQKFLHRWAVVTSHSIITMTQYLADQLRSHLKISRTLEITVIPIGVNLSIIRRKENLEYRQNNEPGNFIRAVQVARLESSKGQDTVLRAVKEIFQKGYKISVDFIGDESYPGYRNYLYHLIAELNLPTGALNLLGYHPLEQVYQELVEYDIFLQLSHREGQGIAVLEAMAAGLPVVASEVGGLKELVVHGKTGLLVPREDHRALAEAIIWLIQNPTKRIEMGEAGFQRAKENFSLEITESKIINFYENLRSKYCA